MGQTGFYKDQTVAALTASYVIAAWNFPGRVITVTNDDTVGSNLVVVSFDGTDAAYKLKPGEVITFDNTNEPAVLLKYETGAPAYRLMVKGD